MWELWQSPFLLLLTQRKQPVAGSTCLDVPELEPVFPSHGSHCWTKPLWQRGDGRAFREARWRILVSENGKPPWHTQEAAARAPRLCLCSRGSRTQPCVAGWPADTGLLRTRWALGEEVHVGSWRSGNSGQPEAEEEVTLEQNFLARNEGLPSTSSKKPPTRKGRAGFLL